MYICFKLLFNIYLIILVGFFPIGCGPEDSQSIDIKPPKAPKTTKKLPKDIETTKDFLNVQIDGKDIPLGSTIIENSANKKIKIKAVGDGVVSVKIFKDSDPKFLNKIDLKSTDAKDLNLNVKKSEGENVYTIRAEKVINKNKVTNEYNVILRHPLKISHPDPTSHDIDAQRLNIDIKFKHPIRTSFDDMFNARKNFLTQTITSAKKPNIFVLFFDTLRKDYAELHAPQMSTFMRENVTPKFHWVNGTSTVYSTFSMFHALPAFLTYNYVLANHVDPNDFGSFPLKILRKLGYEIYTFGYYWGCLPFPPSKVSKALNPSYEDWLNWVPHVRNNFGRDTELLTLCTRPNKDNAIVKEFDKNENWETVEAVKREITQILAASNKPHFFFINFYNLHSPYIWNPAMLNISMPSINRKTSTNLANRGLDYLRNGYINAVRSSDENFLQMIKFIKSLPNGDDSIIVLISDHGERLKEKVEKIGHGGRPFREIQEGVLSIKLGNDSNLFKDQVKDDLFSSADLFPALFDYLKVNPSPEPLLVGKSFLDINKKRNSTLTVRSSGSDATREMALTNGEYKILIYFDKKDYKNFYQDATGFKIIDITDINDNPVFNKPPFSPACNPEDPGWSSAKCRDVIVPMFKDALEEIFPNMAKSP